MKEKTLKKFILSHVIIQMIVLSTIIPFILFAFNSAQEKHTTAAYSAFASGVEVFAEEIQAADKLVGMMHKYSEVRSIIKMSDPFADSAFYYAAKARELWYVSTQSWNLLRRNYVYFSNNEIVFSPERIFFGWEDFYGYWLRYQDESFEEWSERTRQDLSLARKSFYPSKQICMFDVGAKDVIVYTIPFADTFNSGMVICMIDAEELVSLLMGSEALEEAFVCIYGPDGTLLYSHDAPYAVTAQQKAVSSMKIDGETYRIFSVMDRKTGLSYVAGVPKRAIGMGYEKSFWLLLIYTIIILVVSSYLSVFFAYRQYSPIRDLYQRFRQMTGTPHALGQKDEYQYFLESFTELIRNNQEIRKTISAYDAALTTRAFEDLLRGRYTNGQELQQIISYVSLPVKWRACLGILEMQSEDDEPAAFSLISVELMNAVSKSWKEDVLMHPLRENRVLFVIPIDEDEEPQIISERLNGVMHAIKRETGVEVRFALSDVYDAAEQLPAAYEETKNIMACRHSLEGNVYLPEDVDSSDAPPVITPAAAGKLREYVQNGDQEKAVEFIRSYLSKRYLRERDYGQLYFTIRGILMQMVSTLPAGEICEDLPYYVPERPRDEQTQEMVEISANLCVSFGSRKKGKGDLLKNRLLSYLEENYSDPEIYGKSVAVQFEINEKYLYTFFKEQTGVSFASYLETLRLNQAVELLKNSKFTVNEISQMVGFNSPNTFYKAFRRVYGSSPSVYRSMLKE